MKQCFIGRLREVGEVFEYEGPAGAHLELVSGEFVSMAKRPQLDHDRDGREGGMAPPPEPAAPPAPEPVKGRKAADPERVALFAALDAKGVKYFKGAKTDALKTLLAG